MIQSCAQHVDITCVSRESKKPCMNTVMKRDNLIGKSERYLKIYFQPQNNAKNVTITNGVTAMNDMGGSRLEEHSSHLKV